MSDDSLNFTQKGISPLSKLLLFVASSLALLVADSRMGIVREIRTGMLTLAYPAQAAVKKPVDWFDDSRQFLSRQSDLLQRNQYLEERNIQLSARLAQAQIRTQEVMELKKILQLHESPVDFITAAEVISEGRDPVTNRLIINKGSHDGVQEGQAVTDADGFIGQITTVSPYSATVSLLNYENNVIPVMVARTGFRTLIYGESHRLDLRYFPADADLKINDVLVTSGIDENYPAGIPVAQITRLEKSAGTPYYRAQTQILGKTDAVRYVLIWPLNRKKALSEKKNG